MAVIGLVPKDFVLGWFSSRTSLYLCSTLFNTKRLRELGGFNSKHNLCQDVMAEALLVARFGRVDIEPIRARFRKHSGEMTFETNVRKGCEDSLELLDTLCDLAHEKKALIRSQGLKFFSQLNYQRASVIQSRYQRQRTYLTVFRMYDYQYSPVRFVRSKSPLFRRLHTLTRNAERVVRIWPWDGKRWL